MSDVDEFYPFDKIPINWDEPLLYKARCAVGTVHRLSAYLDRKPDGGCVASTEEEDVFYPVVYHGVSSHSDKTRLLVYARETGNKSVIVSDDGIDLYYKGRQVVFNSDTVPKECRRFSLNDK